jgi:hypothetical protein
MGEPRDIEERDRDIQITDLQRKKYLEFSLRGKWGALAREFIVDHCPCKVALCIEKLTPLMPTHIRYFCKNGKCVPYGQFELAREGVRRLVKSGICLVVDGRIVSCQQRLHHAEYKAMVEIEIAKGKDIDLNSLANNKKTKDMIRTYLNRHGYRSFGNGVYRKYASD